MPKPDVVLISKLDGPPSFTLPLSAAENHEIPLKSYVSIITIQLRHTLHDLRNAWAVQTGFIGVTRGQASQ